MDTLNKYPWETIRQEYNILVRYDLSLQDMNMLRNRNGDTEIQYPPDSRMRDMKMYPPYETSKNLK
jgi:hypothetical protein